MAADHSKKNGADPDAPEAGPVEGAQAPVDDTEAEFSHVSGAETAPDAGDTTSAPVPGDVTGSGDAMPESQREIPETAVEPDDARQEPESVPVETAEGNGLADPVPSAAESEGEDNNGEDNNGEDEQSAEPESEETQATKEWYILKVQVNREDSIRQALLRRIKIEGLEEHFDEIIVPTEDIVEFNKSGKRKVVRRKLYPGYILVHMAINDDTWFLIRETPGVGDFTGSAGKPTPMDARDVERILRLGVAQEDGGREIKTSIPFRAGDRVRVKDGHFQNFEGEVDSIDEANGRITVMINIFNRSTPVELEHWQVESV